jgi:threonine dehydratase
LPDQVANDAVDWFILPEGGHRACREDLIDAVTQARGRIAPYVRETPCRLSPMMSETVGAEVWLKLENLQHSGSFKLRGVINTILSLSPADSRKLLVAASTGNHGAAFAYAINLFGLHGTLFMPCTAAPVKVEEIRATSIALEMVGDDCVEAETRAAAFAREHDGVWISPYNDPEVVAGQGTIAAELLEQLEAFDVVLVPVGGGGLISGIARHLKSIDPSIEVIGCQPSNSCVMSESIRAGGIVNIESLPTLSDATAGGIEAGSITFEICRRFVDDFILVEEDEIFDAMKFLYDHEKMAIEGGAALPAAAAMVNRDRFAGRRVVLVISGGRVDEKIMKNGGPPHGTRRHFGG